MADEIRVSGSVRGVQNRTEVHGGGQNMQTTSTSILVFRLDPLDGSRPVNVEMRGSRINGTVVDGEVVHVYGKQRRSGVVRAKRIVSQETGATIDTKLPAALRVFAAIIGLAVLGVFVFVGLSFFRNGTDTLDPRPRQTNDGQQRLEEMRERQLRECLAENTFTDDQCRHVYGARP